jgi:hypothetical protein
MKIIFLLAACGFVLFGFGAVVPGADKDGLGVEETGQGRVSGLGRRAEDEEIDSSVSATVVVGEKTAMSTFTSTTESTPTPTPSDDQLDDDFDDFLSFASYSRLAQEEITPCPYEQVFTNENATAVHQPIQTERLDAYDATSCAELCNTHGACKSFGVFIERQPSCTDCSNPLFEEAFMCELYNTALDRDDVAEGNTGKSIRRQVFTRAVRASNGYNRLGQATTVYAATSTDTVYLAGRTATVVSFTPGPTVTVVPTSTVTVTDPSPRQTLTVISVSTQTSTLTQTLIIDSPPLTTTQTTTFTSTATAYAIVSASASVSVSTKTKTETEIETDTETETMTFTVTPVDPAVTQYWRV